MIVQQLVFLIVSNRQKLCLIAIFASTMASSLAQANFKAIFATKSQSCREKNLTINFAPDFVSIAILIFLKN